jgi:hypothetical protein
MKMVVNPQGQIDHLNGFGNDLGAAPETGPELANVAVVLLDGKEPAPAQAGVRSLPVKSWSSGIRRWQPSQSSAMKVLPVRPTLSRSC